MINPLIDVALAASNHLLKQQDDWAPRSLQPYAGDVIQLTVLIGEQPSTAFLQITPDGYFAKANEATHTEPRARLTTPLKIDHVGTWSRDGFAGLMREVRIEGDAELAAALGRLAKELRWDAEEDLSRLVGDIAAHRIATGAKDFLTNAKRFFEQSKSSTLQKAAAPEGPLVSAAEMETFKRDLRELRDGLDRLQQRVELSRRS